MMSKLDSNYNFFDNSDPSRIVKSRYPCITISKSELSENVKTQHSQLYSWKNQHYSELSTDWENFLKELLFNEVEFVKFRVRQI